MGFNTPSKIQEICVPLLTKDPFVLLYFGWWGNFWVDRATFELIGQLLGWWGNFWVDGATFGLMGQLLGWWGNFWVDRATFGCSCNFWFDRATLELMGQLFGCSCNFWVDKATLGSNFILLSHIYVMIGQLCIDWATLYCLGNFWVVWATFVLI